MENWKDILYKEIKRLKNTLYSDVRLDEREELKISFEKEVIKSVVQEKSIIGGVRVYKSSGYGFASFSNYGEIRDALKNAVYLADFYRGEKIKFKEMEKVEGDFTYPSRNPPSRFKIQDKFEFIKNCIEEIFENKFIIGISGTYLETKFKRLFTNTEESLILQQREEIIFYMQIFAGKKDLREKYLVYYAGRDFKEFKNSINVQIKKAKDYLSELIKSPRIKTGIYDVVIDPYLAGVFAHEAVGHLSEADIVFKNKSMEKIFYIGRKIGNKLISIVDDGRNVKNLGGYFYDDEGVKPEKVYILKEGEIYGRLHSRESAAIMGENPNGHGKCVQASFPPIVRMSCTYIEPGREDKESLISSLKNGLYIEGNMGGWTEIETFCFYPLRVWKVEKGKIKHPLRQVILKGNVFETLKNIEGISKDFIMQGIDCGKGGQAPLPVSYGGPYLLIKNMKVCGE